MPTPRAAMLAIKEIISIYPSLTASKRHDSIRDQLLRMAEATGCTDQELIDAAKRYVDEADRISSASNIAKEIVSRIQVKEPFYSYDGSTTACREPACLKGRLLIDDLDGCAWAFYCTCEQGRRLAALNKTQETDFRMNIRSVHGDNYADNREKLERECLKRYYETRQLLTDDDMKRRVPKRKDADEIAERLGGLSNA